MEIQKQKTKLILLILISFVSLSCSKNDIFSEFQAINVNGWHKDSLYQFSLPISDLENNYNLYLNVRNTNDYSYQNFWIFITRVNPDGTSSNDTIECYLADQRGKWLGSGVGPVKEMPILYQQKISFPKTGVYQYKIGHGMRDTLLSGISDIGIRVERSEN